MRIKLDLDSEATDALVASAMHELRPPNLQAQVLLRRALGLPFPPEPCSSTTHTNPAGKESPEPAGTAR
jgi:hypothetical protein